MSHREIKSNTYGTSTHFSCFLQNWSSCKTVIIEILQQVSIPHLPKNTMTIQYHKRRSYLLKKAYLFKLWDQTCPSLKKKKKKKFKGVVLELLAPIYNREKSSIHSRDFFPPEASFPALDGGVDRLSTKVFLPWSDLVCPLLMQAP